jgi:hypothetical protein
MAAPPAPAHAAPTCPRCNSTHVTAGARGFKLGTALKAGFFIGPVGLLTGAVGRKDVVLNCMTCGHRWEPAALARESASSARRSAPANVSSMSAERLFVILGGVMFVLIAIVAIPRIAALNDPTPVMRAPAAQPVRQVIPEVDVTSLPTAKKKITPPPKKAAVPVEAGPSLEDYVRQSISETDH